MTNKRSNYPPMQRGMALIIVLWVVVLLAVIAAGHSSNAHTTTLMAARQIELAQLRAAANAGLQRAIIELLTQGRPDPWPVNGREQSIDFRDHEVSVAIRDATGLLDLNKASPALLAAVIEPFMAEQAAREALVDAILDWRDADNLVRLNGAEAAAYSPGQLGWTIRNGPFAAVAELRYVIGMTDDVFAHLAPLVTVYSGRSGVNIEYAPAELVRALTGEELMAVSPARPRATPSASRQTLGGARAGTFHITIRATSATAASAATLAAVVRIAPTADTPFTILHWQEPVRLPPPASG